MKIHLAGRILSTLYSLFHLAQQGYREEGTGRALSSIPVFTRVEPAIII